jgi:hypothetical protein
MTAIDEFYERSFSFQRRIGRRGSRWFADRREMQNVFDTMNICKIDPIQSGEPTKKENKSSSAHTRHGTGHPLKHSVT